MSDEKKLSLCEKNVAAFSCCGKALPIYTIIVLLLLSAITSCNISIKLKSKFLANSLSFDG